MKLEDLKIELPKIVKPTLELPDPDLVNYYRDLENRVIWVLGVVDEQSYDWAQRIIEYNRQDKDIPPEERKPIKLFIANQGGALEEANMLIELISISQTPIHAIALGLCASAASIIFLSCHKRFALPNATFLFHKGSCSDITGSYTEVQAFMEQYNKEVEKLLEFYKKRTSFTNELIEEKMKGDWYISATEALDAGVINEIVQDIDLLL